MYILEAKNPVWTDRTITCLFCKTRIKLERDDQPAYAHRISITLGRGEQWQFEWTCLRCNQTIQDSMFVPYANAT